MFYAIYFKEVTSNCFIKKKKKNVEYIFDIIRYFISNYYKSLTLKMFWK